MIVDLFSVREVTVNGKAKWICSFFYDEQYVEIWTNERHTKGDEVTLGFRVFDHKLFPAIIK